MCRGASFAKMATWCEVRRKQPTRARFVNWLNREDPPMSSGQLPQTAGVPKTVEEFKQRQEAKRREELEREEVMKKYARPTP